MLEQTILFNVKLGHFGRYKNESSIDDSEEDDRLEHYSLEFI